MNVDEFVVQLGLDPSELTEQQRNVLRAIAQLKTDAAKDAKKVENQFAKTADAVEAAGRRMVNVIGLLVGTTSAIDFGKKAIEDVRQLGIMADLIGVNVRELSAFGRTFERLGGSAEGVFSTLSAMDREIKSMEANLTAPGDSKLLDVVRQLNALGASIRTHNEDGTWRKPTELLTEIAEATPKLKAVEDRVKGILRQLPGMNDETLAVMLRSAAALRQQIEKQHEILSVSNDNRQAIDALRTKWTEVSQSAEQVGVSIMTTVAKPLTLTLDAISKFLKYYQSLPFINQIASLVSPLSTAAGFATRSAMQAAGISPAPQSTASGGLWGTGGSGAGNQTGQATQPNDKSTPPTDILNKAQEVALRGGPEAVDAFMRQQGYPKSGQWCGQFAASVVKAAGGTPPANPAIASNWRNFGYPVTDPQPGDIAVRKGAPTGRTGSHVTIVEKFDPKTGRFIGLGGNQRGGFQSRFLADTYEFRRSSDPWTQGVKPMLYPGMVTGGRANVITNNRNSTRVEIGTVQVTTQSETPSGMAGDIRSALQAEQKAAPR